MNDLFDSYEDDFDDVDFDDTDDPFVSEEFTIEREIDEQEALAALRGQFGKGLD